MLTPPALPATAQPRVRPPVTFFSALAAPAAPYVGAIPAWVTRRPFSAHQNMAMGRLNAPLGRLNGLTLDIAFTLDPCSPTAAPPVRPPVPLFRAQKANPENGTPTPPGIHATHGNFSIFAFMTNWHSRGERGNFGKESCGLGGPSKPWLTDNA